MTEEQKLQQVTDFAAFLTLKLFDVSMALCDIAESTRDNLTAHYAEEVVAKINKEMDEYLTKIGA